MQELTLKEIQQSSYQILKKIKEICDSNNITYFLDYGTLIGAIRHEGFIPWDDDIDISLPRKDYEKLVNLCIQDPSIIAPFELLHYKTNKNYIYPIARINDPSYYTDYQNAKDYGLGAFVDVYPVDGININDKKHLKKLLHLNNIIYVAGHKHMSKARNLLRNIPKFIFFIITRFTNLNKLIAKVDKLSQKYDFDNSNIVSACVIESCQHFEKTDYTNPILHKFEDELFNIPQNYDKHLRSYIGDYMQLPPKEERVGHHFYKMYKKN